MELELTDGEWTTVLVALDNYSSTKNTDWQDSGCEDDELRAESSGSEWLWQKVFAALDYQRNMDRINAEIRERSGWEPCDGVQPELPFNTQTNSGDSASVDPYDLSQYEDMGWFIDTGDK